MRKRPMARRGTRRRRRARLHRETRRDELGDDCQEPRRCFVVARAARPGSYTWHRWRNGPWRTLDSLTHSLSLSLSSLALSRLVQNRYLRLDRRRLSHFVRRPLPPRHSRAENSLRRVLSGEAAYLRRYITHTRARARGKSRIYTYVVIRARNVE